MITILKVVDAQKKSFFSFFLFFSLLITFQLQCKFLLYIHKCH